MCILFVVQKVVRIQNKVFCVECNSYLRGKKIFNLLKIRLRIDPKNGGSKPQIRNVTFVAFNRRKMLKEADGGNTAYRLKAPVNF